MAAIPDAVAARRPLTEADRAPGPLHPQSTGADGQERLTRAWAKPARWGFFTEPNNTWVGLLLVAFLQDPPSLVPKTAMPNVGLSLEEARDIAAYLYTLGSKNGP